MQGKQIFTMTDAAFGNEDHAFLFGIMIFRYPYPFFALSTVGHASACRKKRARFLNTVGLYAVKNMF